MCNFLKRFGCDTRTTSNGSFVIVHGSISHYTIENPNLHTPTQTTAAKILIGEFARNLANLAFTQRFDGGLASIVDLVVLKRMVWLAWYRQYDKTTLTWLLTTTGLLLFLATKVVFGDFQSCLCVSIHPSSHFWLWIQEKNLLGQQQSLNRRRKIDLVVKPCWVQLWLNLLGVIIDRCWQKRSIEVSICRDVVTKFQTSVWIYHHLLQLHHLT